MFALKSQQQGDEEVWGGSGVGETPPWWLTLGKAGLLSGHCVSHFRLHSVHCEASWVSFISKPPERCPGPHQDSTVASPPFSPVRFQCFLKKVLSQEPSLPA